MNSKEYSWKWVTADELLSHGACELIYAELVPNAAGTATATYYDGENTNGETIIRVRRTGTGHQKFSPKEPIYCRRGLYIDVISNVRGIFVQWREIGHKGEK